jgi:hypothetical protein
MNKQNTSVFTHLFSNPENERELTAFSAIPINQNSVIEDCTITDDLFNEQINVVSFKVDNRLLIFFEQQSDINENFPMITLFYCRRVYERILFDALYRTKLVEIPTPEFIVLYNGIAPFPEKKVYKLSESFAQKTASPSLELVVTVYNICDGKNTKLLSKCNTLREYSAFVSKIREFESDGTRKYIAVRNAIKHCVNNAIICDYLKENEIDTVCRILNDWSFLCD